MGRNVSPAKPKGKSKARSSAKAAAKGDDKAPGTAAEETMPQSAAMQRDSTRFTRQDNIEETWRIMQPLVDKPPKVHPYKPGSWGPKAADELVADYGGWHGPWTAS